MIPDLEGFTLEINYRPEYQGYMYCMKKDDYGYVRLFDDISESNIALFIDEGKKRPLFLKGKQ